MSNQLSFTKFENDLLPGYRKQINMAESSEEVKTYYTRTALELLHKVFSAQINFDYNDIVLSPGTGRKFVLSQRLLESEEFSKVLNNSDLANILSRLSDSALNRYTHLEKHPEKTEAKIRM